MSIKDIFLAILVAFLWGSAFVAVKFNLEEVPAFLSAAVRFILTAVMFVPFVAKPKVSFIELVKVSLVYGVLYVDFIYYAMYLGVNPSLAVIIGQLAAPFSILIGRAIFKEELTLRSVLGIAFSFLGVVIVVSNPAHFHENYLALFIMILGAFFNAVFNAKSKQLKEVPALSLYCWVNLVGALPLLIIACVFDGNPITLLEKATSVFWLSSFYIVISGLIFLSIWINLLQKYQFSEVMPYNLLVPVFGVLLSAIILHENITWHLVVGGVVIIMGIYISHVKAKVVAVDSAKKA